MKAYHGYVGGFIHEGKELRILGQYPFRFFGEYGEYVENSEVFIVDLVGDGKSQPFGIMKDDLIFVQDDEELLIFAQEFEEESDEQEFIDSGINHVRKDTKTVTLCSSDGTRHHVPLSSVVHLFSDGGDDESDPDGFWSAPMFFIRKPNGTFRQASEQ